MMKSYVVYDDAGVLTGAYLQELSEDHQSNHIEVTDEQRLAWTDYRANEDRTGLELAPVATPEPRPQARHLTVLAFRNRFTRAEKIRIELAAIDEPTAEPVLRERAAMVRIGQADLAAATYVDADREDTRADVQAFEAMDLLDAPGRALEILDAPIQVHERYNG